MLFERNESFWGNLRLFFGNFLLDWQSPDMFKVLVEFLVQNVNALFLLMFADCWKFLNRSVVSSEHWSGSCRWDF